MMGLGQVGALGRLGAPALAGGGWWLSESQLDLDFANDRAFNRSAGFNGSPNSLLTYTSPSPKMVYGDDGVLFQSSGNLPYDHDPITHEPLGVLIEEQRTNLLTYSEQFDNAAWTKTGSSISANAVAAPNGTTTADKIVEDSANSTHGVSIVNTGGAASTASTFSIFAKAAERSKLRILNIDNATGGVEAIFDLAAGTVGAASTSGNYSSGSAAIQDVGNGWYRCSVTATKSGAGNTSIVPIVQLYTTTQTYLGNGASGAYVWGAQVEQAASFPTSYIPAVASQVTRAADRVSILTSAFAFSFSKGTVAFDGSVLAMGISSQRILQTGGSGRLMYVSGNQVAIYDGTTIVPATGSIVANTAFTATNAYDAADGLAACFNGGAVATGAFDGAMAASASLYFGSDNNVAGFLNGHIARLTYWNTRKTNAELQVLST